MLNTMRDVYVLVLYYKYRLGVFDDEEQNAIGKDVKEECSGSVSWDSETEL